MRPVAVGQQRRHGQGGTGVLRYVPVLDGEELVPVGDPPQLRAGGVDQSVVGDQPLLVERSVQDPHRLGARAGLPCEPGGGGGLAGQRRDRSLRVTGTGGPEKLFALGSLGADQTSPTGLEGTGVRGRHPGAPGAQGPYGPWHEVIEQRDVVVPMRLRRPPVLPPCRPPRRHVRRPRHRNGASCAVSALRPSPRTRTCPRGTGSVPHPPPGRSRRTSPLCRRGSG